MGVFTIAYCTNYEDTNMQQTFNFEPRKSKLRGRFFSQEEILFPTYLLVIQETQDVVKPVTIVLNGEFVQFHTLSSEQRKQPIYQVLSIDDNMQINGYHTFDRDPQKFVDWWNVTEECDWINPEYVPKVKIKLTDIRFAHRDNLQTYYGMKLVHFKSYWKNGFKTLQELDQRALELTPKYDVDLWRSLMRKHDKHEITIVKSDNTIDAMRNGEVIESESLEKLTVVELERRVGVKDYISSSMYMTNIESHVSLGLKGTEREYRLDGIPLTREQMLPLLQLEGNAILLPQDIRFSVESYSILKQLFINATGKYKNSSFVFDSSDEAKEMFNRLLDGENINVKKLLQYFPTTEEASKDFLDGLDFHGLTVFEPNGGEGYLVRKALEMGAKEVLSAEIYTKFHPALEASGATIIGEDLFNVTAEDVAKVDVVVMNPPFTGGLDVKHLLHVLSIIPDHTPIYSIMSGSLKANKTAVYEEFRNFLDSIGVPINDIDQGAFKESGTNVSSTYVHIPAKDQHLQLAA